MQEIKKGTRALDVLPANWKITCYRENHNQTDHQNELNHRNKMVF